MSKNKSSSKRKIIYDPLYGFIHLSRVEWEIIHTPFYQRLKWIKQIGFSFYTFPGAEHSRFGHSIGVLFNAHKILTSIGEAVTDDELFDEKVKNPKKELHQSVRLAALLHDLGTFCFSHTTEMAYIRFGDTTNAKNSKGHSDDHENLGSFIIKNTDYENGITYILKKYNLDPKLISDLVKGVAPNLLANQILHSEIDCDRMDYLLRDAHYTGLDYGAYDRDYLLHHFKKVEVGGHYVLAINHNAIHCVEDFMNSRFAWYSQVVRSSRGARFDALACELTFYLLEKGKIYSYTDLLRMIENDPMKFFGFNDQYFMNLIHDLHQSSFFDKNIRMKEIANAILLGKAPRTIKCKEFKQRLLDQDDKSLYDKVVKRAKDKISDIEEILKRKGTPRDWLVVDLPQKDITFCRSKKRLIERREHSNILLERDPVKILDEYGELNLLVDLENSTISRLQNLINFVPNVYCSESAYEILQSEGVI